MNSEEVIRELDMDYDELVKYLLEKYGPAQCDYFRNESCKSKNPKVTRTSEGLVCHHIDEDKAIMLSNDKFAINNPYEYQKADRLVYCNILEHLILHIKIVEMPPVDGANKNEIQGIGGAVNFICPQINDFFNGYQFKQAWMIKQFSLIENNFEDYIHVLNYLFETIALDPILSIIVSRERVSKGYTGEIVQKVYERII